MKKAIICSLFILLASSLLAQNKNHLGLYFSFYHASDAFEEKITRMPIGTAVNYLRAVSDRISIGAEFSMGLYSGKKYFYRTVDEGFSDNIERLYEENGFLSYQFVFRYSLLENDVIEPYLAFKGGASTFFSAIRAMQVSTVFNDGFFLEDTALNLGLGGGVAIDLSKAEWRRKLLIDVSGVYQLGSEVRYRNSIKDELVNSYNENYRQSVTNAMHYKFGLVLVY